MNPYIGCYVECVRGRWRVSYPDGEPVSLGRYRSRQSALNELWRWKMEGARLTEQNETGTRIPEQASEQASAILAARDEAYAKWLKSQEK